MGLDVSHNAFLASYGAFHRFRKKVAEAWGGSYADHKDKTFDPDSWYAPDGTSEKTNPGLWTFFNSQDCEGSFSPSMAKKIADEMEALLPKIRELDDGGGGHIERDGGYAAVAERYIKGCRAAHKARQRLRYR